MEADWEFEIGGGAPVIESWWPGFVDLRQNPGSVVELPEAMELPLLGGVLILLNAVHSPVWTSKCGVWINDEGERFDPDEFDAPPGGTTHINGCYIDLLPRREEQWPTVETIAASCKSWNAGLRALRLRSCRADFIIRQAFTPPERMDLGLTAYLTGCGSTPDEARAALEAALTSFAGVLCAHPTPKNDGRD